MQGRGSDLRHRKFQKLTISYGNLPASSNPVAKRNDPGRTLSPFVAYGGVITFLILLNLLSIFENILPAQIQVEKADAHPGRFIGQRAELQLKRLTSLGTRVVGSYENEVLAVDFLKREVSFIAQGANKIHKIEVDIQKPTGSYYLMFKKPQGFRNYYANIQNFVVKLSSWDSPNSILMNCHYDTVPESPGASDNGINCVVMLEILRVLASGVEQLKNNVIFLFNGAEENPLQASHGFSTQQKWKKEVKVVINLDSCGAGGREILFQTSGEHWLVKTFAQAVLRPVAAVHAEEMFHFGIIPSDTDFRIFRDYGRYSGFDMVQCANGYIYHTKFDSVDFIPPGVYQSTGDNMLALVRKLVNSSELGTNKPEERKTRIVYFDVFTLFMIVYTEKSAIILNLVTCVLSACAAYRSYIRMTGSSRSAPKRLSIAAGGQMLGFLVGFVSVYFTSTVLDAYDSTMSWYPRHWLIIPLYVFPVAVAQTLALLITEICLGKDLLKHKVILLINGSQIFSTVLLLGGTLTGIRTSFMLMGVVLFPSVGSLCVTLSKKLYSAKAYLIAYFICLAFPVLFILNQSLRVFAVMIPMTARMGPQVNPEKIIGLLAFMSTQLFLCPFVSCLLLIRKSKTFLLSIFILHTITVLIILSTPFGFPYDYNVKRPTLQRFYVLHCDRTFHDAKGLVRKADSGIFVQSLDRNDIKYVSRFLPELQGTRTANDDCATEVFCGFPIYTSRFIKPAPYSHWIPAALPTIHHPTSLEIVNQTQVLVNIRRIRILVTGPDHITIGLSPRPGVNLVRWSFGRSPPAQIEERNGRKTYMVYYSHGLMGGTLEFDIDLEICQNHTDSLMDVAVIGHYMHDKKFRTDEFNNLLSKFPKWAHLTPWTTTYKSWVI